MFEHPILCRGFSAKAPAETPLERKSSPKYSREVLRQKRLRMTDLSGPYRMNDSCEQRIATLRFVTD
jgi:hypothetical protein